MTVSFSIISNMSSPRKAVLIMITIMILGTECLFCASVFSDYDFTFYKTVSQSLAIMDSSTFGLDYTGFGFIGNSRTNGLFVRIGLQAPLATIGSIWQDDKIDASDENGDTGITAGDETYPSTEFRFTLILGPAVRYVFSPAFDAYAGIGFKIEEHVMMLADSSGTYENTSYDTLLALDWDMGVKFNIENNTSVRIGIYSTFEILSYDYNINRKDDRKDYNTSDIRLNIIASGDARTPLSAVGYISLGKTFSSSNVETVYRYEIISDIPGTGNYVPLS